MGGGAVPASSCFVCVRLLWGGSFGTEGGGLFLFSSGILLPPHSLRVNCTRALEPNCETLVVEEKNRADIKRFVTSKINDLWRKIRHIAEPTAGEFSRRWHTTLLINLKVRDP